MRQIDDHEAISRIHGLLDGVEWDSGTLEEIASVLISAGYKIRDCDELEDWERAG